ncbi:hypothetical protein DVA86_10010 [Streptomyces armeniacus]|uniref:Uncharacterized protein n=1 Tax=Streptomyces armeniacus TaxID=83291 RepID=A0A345XMR7_9ACTN|nr:hypothetical protein [Streptomyces armeniacus]AXK32933.1 hypothetical protein DVA86_10010 [Streptomyces armeniacus]
MTDRRRRAAHAEPSQEDNPFAPPPEDQPDRPWQPRRPAGSPDNGGNGDGGGNGGQDGGGRNGNGNGRDGNGDEGGRPSRWGSKWSPRQPGRQSGGFGGTGQQGPGGPGQGPGGNGNGNGNGGNGNGKNRGMRWDPTDPYQRHARYSLHTGIWGLFFALFSLSEIALLLGALSVYWGISGLRAKPPGTRRGSGSRGGTRASAEDVAGTDRPADSGTQGGGAQGGAPPIPISVTPAQAAKARTSAAISGLVTGGLALVIVAGTFSLQLIYSDYYNCKNDSLTQASRQQCDDLVPDGIRPILENQG